MTEIKFHNTQVACVYEYINSNGVWQEKENPAWQFLNTNPKAAWEYLNRIAVEAGKRVDRRNIRFVWRGVTTEPMRVLNLREAEVLAGTTWVDAPEHSDRLLNQFIAELDTLIARYR